MAARCKTSREYSYGEEYNSTPEKLLLAALLERSIRDIINIAENRRAKQEATIWFLDTEESKEPWFTFYDCIDHLELTKAQVQLIQDTARKHLNDKQQTEGETDRVGSRSLAERAWNTISEKKPAVLRKGRRRFIRRGSFRRAAKLAY